MKSLIIYCISISLVIFCPLRANCQRPPQSFFDGLDNFSTDPAKAKELFLQTVKEDSTFHGSYNFLGILLSREKKYDSAIDCLSTSIRLNRNNVNHTKEMTLERLCRIYLYVGDFENSYNTALNSIKEFPDNPDFLYSLREACLWSYHTKFGGLSLDYLKPDVKNEYLVNSVDQEYLIMRNITVNDRSLVFRKQSYDTKNNIDILKCSVSGTKDSVTLIFKLGWDVLKTFADNMPDYKIAYNDKNIKIWYRLGAIIVHDSKVDLLKEIAKLEP